VRGDLPQVVLFAPPIKRIVGASYSVSLTTQSFWQGTFRLFQFLKLSQGSAAKASYKYANAMKKMEKLEEFLQSIWFAPKIGLAKSIGEIFIFLEFP
jgi:hypothetical protein